MKKKILIIGPFGDIGGRELEVGFIASVFSVDYLIRVVSTSNYFENSEVCSFGKVNYTSLNKEIFNNNRILNFIVLIISFLKKGLKYDHKSLSSPLIKKCFPIENNKLKVIESEVENSDLVFICAQVYTNYIKSIVFFAKKRKLPVIFRTTGTIKDDIDKLNFNWINQVNLFLHHSQNNANKICKFYKTSYSLIDQCSFIEDKLLNIRIEKNEVKKYFILSRLAPEKRIDVVINAFNNVSNESEFLYIYGEGPIKKELQRLARNNKRIIFMGYVYNNDIDEVLKNNDCLIISSPEEAGPLTGIEAMAAGRLIFSTKVGAMQERIAEDYPFWFDGKEESLEKLIIKARNKNSVELHKLKKNLRQVYLLNYTFDKISKKYLESVFKLFYK